MCSQSKFALYAFLLLLCCHCAAANNMPPDTIAHGTPQRTFAAGLLTETQLQALEQAYGQHKKIPAQYRAQILTALSFFPELRDVQIDFVMRKSMIPLSSRPRFTSLLRSAKTRRYMITISTKTVARFDPILLAKLNYNAQVGVLGHEISHIANYIHTSFWGISRIGWNLIFSERATDRFEAGTDETCIRHGLGFQLLDWSIATRKALGSEEWFGAKDHSNKAQPARERYLKPSTIRAKMAKLKIYQGLLGAETQQ